MSVGAEPLRLVRSGFCFCAIALLHPLEGVLDNTHKASAVLANRERLHMTKWTMQTAFDQAARGVLWQGRPSHEHGDCQYRSSHSDKPLLCCGVGWLIDDETAASWEFDVAPSTLYNDAGAYIPDLPVAKKPTGYPAEMVAETLEAVADSSLSHLDLRFLADLQSAHDMANENAEMMSISWEVCDEDFVDHFRALMLNLAYAWDLDPAAILGDAPSEQPKLPEAA